MSSRYSSLLRCSRLGLVAAVALTGLSVAACGGGNSPAPTKPVGQDDAGEDSGTTVRRDAGSMSMKDAGREEVDSGSPFHRDAGHDSGTSGKADAGDAGSGGDIDMHPIPAPDTWKCAKAIWSDGYCDCGCGATDSDCVGQSCIEPGCINQNCDACYTTELAWKPCTPAPNPSDWSCSPESQRDGICDCGCTVADGDCRGNGCTDPGCWRAACEMRHDSDGMTLPDQRPPLAWACASASWGGGDGCDCGCGAPDPDCQSQNYCTQAKCNNTECSICHDSAGRIVTCSDALSSWTCDPQRFGSNDGCDCGCGTPDPDCAEQGCVEQGCATDACKRCTSTDFASDRLVGCAPPQWTCDPGHYGTGDGCDCGCGIADPDCGMGNGCTGVGCQNDKCDYCHTGPTDSFSDYQICMGWTCGTTNDPAWNEASCDCGCGKPDPYCRVTNRFACSEPGCKTATCEYCTNTTGNRAQCDGPQWASSGTCGRSLYGLDGKCDCGCEAIDPDCGKDEGCAAPFCAGTGCEVCHGSGSRLATCYTWTCPKESYGDGKCDCGCGAPDPDCKGVGCTEPGCRGDKLVTDAGVIDDVCRPDGCHDPFGRNVACP